jgi:hypothetical protein
MTPVLLKDFFSQDGIDNGLAYIAGGLLRVFFIILADEDLKV